MDAHRPAPTAPDDLFAWRRATRSPDSLVGRRVTQCALSRICGVCGRRSAGRSRSSARRREVGRNAFHLPAAARRRACGARRVTSRTRATTTRPGELVTTAGFEFVRPGREDDDRRPTFQPNSLLGDRSGG